MSFSIEFADETEAYDARIKVIGCGGSGGNAVNTMINFGLEGVEFIVVNTDAQALSSSLAPQQDCTSARTSRAASAPARTREGPQGGARGRDPPQGDDLRRRHGLRHRRHGRRHGHRRRAGHRADRPRRGRLTVGVVTKPFLFEGKQRSRRAEIGLAMLAEHVDTLITIPNQKLLSLGRRGAQLRRRLPQGGRGPLPGVKGISDLITQSGIVNVDFADVKTVMSNMGRALMGTGCAKGQGRARLAAEMAISRRSSTTSRSRAPWACSSTSSAARHEDEGDRGGRELIQEQAHEDANIIFGATIDESMGDMMKVTVIATGFDPNDEMHHPQAQSIRTAPTTMSFGQPSHASLAQQAQAQALHAHGPASAPAARQGMRPSIPAEELVPAQTRRAPARELSTASAPRDRASFVPPLDSDWDTPAFQRRGS
jgi:cell division protein FtsZ